MICPPKTDKNRSHHDELLAVAEVKARELSD